MSRVCRCLTATLCLNKQKFDNTDFGRNYWNGFRKRWEHTLYFKRGQKFALDMSAALTFSNMNKMYDKVYDAMVQCKVASKEDQPVYKTDDDEIVTDLKEKFGLPCIHKIDHPKMCLVVDEVGSDLSQKGDGHIGGVKYVFKKGTIPQNKVQNTDKHFTLLGFTALTGEPVHCVIIIAGSQQKLNIEY